jgi:hypothetical protein
MINDTGFTRPRADAPWTLPPRPRTSSSIWLRPASAEAGEFIRHWRERGEEQAARPGFAAVTRYEQCPLITPADEPSLPDAVAPNGPTAAFGGVGAISFRGGLESLAAISPDLHSGAPELPVFGEALTPHLLVVHDEVVFDYGGTELRIYSFLARQPWLSLEQFADHWRRFIETFLAHKELARHCSAYVQDHTLALDPQTQPRFDGVAEMGFRNVDDVVTFLSEPTLVGELFAAEEPFIDRSRGIVLLTRPVAVPAGGRRSRA